MLSEKVNKWFAKAKQNLFNYKDGFYNLPILSSSPEAIIKGVSKMPFVKHSSKERNFRSNTPFLDVIVRYCKIEDGLWYMHSKAFYKESVNYIISKDEDKSSNYFILFLEKTINKHKSEKGLIDGVSYSSSTWVLLKPESGNYHCRFKGSNTSSLVLYMSRTWLEQALIHNPLFKNSTINNFLNSNAKLVAWEESSKINTVLESKSEKILKVRNEKDNSWNNFITEFLTSFLNIYNDKYISENIFNISEASRKQMIQAEQYLLDNISSSFKGIEEISNHIGLSPTKLKKDFKLIYGVSVFQYFRSKQMEAAQIILDKNEGISIKDIAFQFGYTNASKFSIAFKKFHGFLPSNLEK